MVSERALAISRMKIGYVAVSRPTSHARYLPAGSVQATGRPGEGDDVTEAQEIATQEITAPTACVSYLHMHILVGCRSQPRWFAALTPLSVDGMILAASTALSADSRSDQRGGSCHHQLPRPAGLPGSASRPASRRHPRRCRHRRPATGQGLPHPRRSQPAAGRDLPRRP